MIKLEFRSVGIQRLQVPLSKDFIVSNYLMCSGRGVRVREEVRMEGEQIILDCPQCKTLELTSDIEQIGTKTTKNLETVYRRKAMALK